MITVIAPHARPDFTANLLTCFRRQRGVEARLLVVENGPAVGSVAPSPGVGVIDSDVHQAEAMNAGLAWLRSNGGGPWARFDDDDYYGPDYLLAVEKSLAGDGVIVSGMPWRYVMLDDGLHQFQGNGDFTGGSLAANTTDVASFNRVADDDLTWCLSMRAQGACFIERAPEGYCYDRRTRQAPRVIPGGSAVTRFGFGISDFYGKLPLDAVDSPTLTPLFRTTSPSNDELLAEMV